MAGLHTKRSKKAVRNYRRYKNSTVDEAIFRVAPEKCAGLIRSGVFRVSQARANETIRISSGESRLIRGNAKRCHGGKSEFLLSRIRKINMCGLTARRGLRSFAMEFVESGGSGPPPSPLLIPENVSGCCAFARKCTMNAVVSRRGTRTRVHAHARSRRIGSSRRRGVSPVVITLRIPETPSGET